MEFFLVWNYQAQVKHKMMKFQMWNAQSINQIWSSIEWD
jgi:hypothetical protein